MRNFIKAVVNRVLNAKRIAEVCQSDNKQTVYRPRNGKINTNMHRYNET